VIITQNRDKSGLRIRPGIVVASCLIVFLTLAPFLWILIVSLTPELSMFTSGVQYFPKNPTIENYLHIFEVVRFGRGFLNSSLVAIIVTVFSITIATFAAYAFARFDFPGRQPMIVGMLLVYMLPGIVLLIPMMVIFKTMKIMNTYAAVILAQSSHSVPYAVWLLTNYIASLPKDLEDAAMVDGASRVQAMVQIVLPIAKPGVVGTALFVFISCWNNFLFAFMFTSGDKYRTLPVLLRSFVGGDSGVYWGTVMAGAVMTTIPIAIAFLFFQTYLVEGLSAGAVKG